MHLHYALLAEILLDVEKSASTVRVGAAEDRAALRDAVQALGRSLHAEPESENEMPEKDDRREARDDKDVLALTPKEEVLLLHIME